MAAVSRKSRLAVALFAFFLGEFGAHRFYLGKMGTAITMLVLSVIGLAPVIWIWAFVDFVFAVSGNMKDKEGKLITRW